MAAPLRLAALLMLLAAPLSAGCGADPAPCEMPEGQYHIALPEQTTNAPLLVFLHGHGGAGSGTISNRALVEPFLARGWAVAAPEGLARRAGGPKSWNFYPGWAGRDETGFLTGVARDAADRFGLSPDRIVLGGFSAGGFMVSYLACAQPEAFAAYLPVAGGFWRPHPDTCAGPVRLLHTHGWTDRTVPLEGRRLGPSFVQGDILAGMEIWRDANRCDGHKPSGFRTTGPVMRRYWDDCAPGSALELALWPGGHRLPPGWSDMVMDWIEALPPREGQE